MQQGHDEISAADLALVIESRCLGPGEADRLVRAVTGAVRPNRDKPFWDLAHAIAALRALQPAGAADPARVVDILLDPALTRPDAIRRHLSGMPDTSASGPSISDEGISHGSWRAGWGQVVRSLALGEFMLTCDGLAHFKTIGAMIADYGDDPQLLTRQLVPLINAYRQAHMPAAAFERRFNAILNHLRDQHGAVTDDAIFTFWRFEIDEGERPQFRTIVEHFATFLKLRTVLADLAGVRGTGSLEAIENWQDRLDDMLADVAGEEAHTSLLATRLAALPDSPKILTGAERDDAISVLGLDPFHKTLPRTVLRTVSFGAVQSGLANRLRRGGGGGTIAERLTCADAESYTAIIARLQTLTDHLKRMVRIAVALRMAEAAAPDERVALVVAEAEADIKRVRRAGFDLPREKLADAFAGVDEMLADATVDLAAFLQIAEKLGGENVLGEIFERDKVSFSEGLTIAYAKEDADDRSVRA